ncbi:sarcalumenin precursor, putative [Trypanosoma brucei gambiense DAL972]|uniref:Sarcalumenin n=2 Tax=Trypanosoma brucei TaxID=5691 RepID=D0A0F1_TRYB9|nr:sarcalumenin precursor, putative [Trypanosoma brucei gambiense DAL972]RHW68615.1 Sarcalumenin [Trypanosoma brucei equiperdum]CBH16709.1 sarcalumenin precursor, putative [Trypanosoma brucei gambiense DAL972]|eukprot:XP_011778973.1 sarcalumenin precursor, putative [Trypanosoma brucei gambiense DAL972]
MSSGNRDLSVDNPLQWRDLNNTEEFMRKLHEIYMKSVKPLEDIYLYEVLSPRWFEETLSSYKPIVTFLGPWSAGKSTFINYLLQDNYLFTGPQPTTSEFTVITYGDDVTTLDGHVVASTKDLPFRALANFGEGFMGNFCGLQVPHELLKRVVLVDTPGVLENSTDDRERRYNYTEVCRWFVERSDVVFLLFDPAKLDAGTELRNLFRYTFKGMEGKLRIVLNKADSVAKKELMRVYGSLFWNLSTLIRCTEPPRVYIGSFWDQPYKPGTFALLFTKEKEDLLYELTELVPRQARDRKVAALISHAKKVVCHAYIVGGIRADLPMFFGKEKAKRKALENLPKTYQLVASRNRLSPKDLPPAQLYHEYFEKVHLEKLPDIKKVEKTGMITTAQHYICNILPSMFYPMKQVPVPDPRNKTEQGKLREMYYGGLRDQYDGKEGKQGSSDTVPIAFRETALGPNPELRGGCGQLTVPGATANTTPAMNNVQMNEQQQQMLMQMMMMMQQQQQQGNNQFYAPR